MNLVRGWAAILIAVAAAVLCSSPVLADGKVFRQAAAVVPMVDQEAIIAFKDCVEVLAIRTRADAQAAGNEPLAWVVPVPSTPELFTTTDGTFVTARTLTQPRLLGDRENWLGPAVLSVGLLLFLSVAVVRVNPGVPAWQRRVMCGILILSGTLCCVVTMLPAMAKARSGGPRDADSGVEVLSAQRVGTLDVTVVRAASGADSAGALAEWLKRAGCAVPPSAQPVIARYAAEGWVFVAAKLAGEGATRLEPTPLVMRFLSTTPVYPMRLTGVGNGPLSLELCVIAEGTASADGLVAARSSPVAAPGEASWGNTISLSHAGLADLVSRAGSPGWITRLSGTLAPEQQALDMKVRIGGCARLHEVLWTDNAAASLGMNVGMALAALGMACLAVLMCLRQWTQRAASISLAACVLGGTVSAFTLTAALPCYQGEVRLARLPSWVQSRCRQEIAYIQVADLTALRAAIEQRRHEDQTYFKNLPAEGDVPWGYKLRTDAKGDAWIDLYDGNGGLDRSEFLYSVGLDTPPLHK